MRNLILNQSYSFSIYDLLSENSQNILSVHFDEFSKNLTVLDKECKIYIFNYEDIFSKFTLLKTIELDAIFYDQFEILEDITNPDPALLGTNSVKYLLYKNEDETIYMITYGGKLLKIPFSGRYEIIELFPEGEILAVEMASNLEFIAVASGKNKLYLLSYDFEIVNSCALDDGDLSDYTKDPQNELKEASISWRGDSQFFATLYSVNGGKKCIVRDTKLSIFKGPARADNKVVFSIAENPVKSIFKNLNFRLVKLHFLAAIWKLNFCFPKQLQN